MLRSNGNKARGVCYNREAFLRDCVRSYTELYAGIAGHEPKLTHADTPSLQEDVKNKCPASVPVATGEALCCPWCNFSMPKEEWKRVDFVAENNKAEEWWMQYREKKKAKQTHEKQLGLTEDTAGAADLSGESGRGLRVPASASSKTGPSKGKAAAPKKGAKNTANAKPDKEQGGILGSIASRVLMKILYGARYARFDLLRSVNQLARHVTRWDSYCDRALHRLI